MIRALAQRAALILGLVLGVALGLALGLALAIGLYGQMAHLRMVTSLPGWTSAIASDATLATGRAALPAGFDMTWRLAGADLRGPYWQGTLSRQDARLPFEARLRWQDRPAPQIRLRLDGGSASLTGPALTGSFPAIAGTGVLGPGGLRLELDAAGQRLAIEGTGRPDGPVSISLGPGHWRLALGGPDPVQAEGTDPAALLGDPADRGD